MSIVCESTEAVVVAVVEKDDVPAVDGDDDVQEEDDQEVHDDGVPFHVLHQQIAHQTLEPSVLQGE